MNALQERKCKKRGVFSLIKDASFSANRSIFLSMITVGGISIFTRGMYIVQDLMLASFFGLGDVLDAFFTAALIPTLTVNVIANSLTYALLPRYVKTCFEEGSEAGNRLLSCVSFWFMALLFSASGVLAVSFPWLLHYLGTSFSVEKCEMSRTLFLIFLPMISLRALATVWSGILNAKNQFAFPCIVQAVTPMMVGLSLLFIRGSAFNMIIGVALATILGAAFELTILWIKLRRLQTVKTFGFLIVNKPAKEVFYQFIPMVVAALLGSCTEVINQSMASSLGTGSVTALNYGCKVVTWVVGFGSITVGTVVMPLFAKMVAQEDWLMIIRTLHFYLRVLFFAALPIMALLMNFSEPVTRLLFQRGSFSLDDTQTVASIQWWFALQVPVYVLNIVIVRLVSCLRGNGILMWGATLNLAICFTLNSLVIPSMGIDGIALTSSIVLAFSCLFSYSMLRHKIYRLQSKTKGDYEQSTFHFQKAI